MKKISNKFLISLSVLLIGFLISTSSLNVVNTKALVEKENNHFSKDSFDSAVWNWTTSEIVSTESINDSQHPSFAFDTSWNLHIAWADNTNYNGAGTDWDIFYKRWEVSNSSWTTTEIVSTESTYESRVPSLTVDISGNVHVVWEEGNQILYKRLNISTSSWTNTEVISDTGEAYSIPSLAADLFGNIHVVWLSNFGLHGPYGFNTRYRGWNDSTQSWSSIELVSTEHTTVATDPNIAVDSIGNVHVVWADGDPVHGAGGDQDILYKRKFISNSSWTTTEVVTIESIYPSYSPTIAIDCLDNVHIAWEEDINYSGTEWDILYKRWNSTSWTSTEVVSTESTDNSQYPSLAIDNSRKVHIAWQDLTDYDSAGADYDIFYKYLNSSSWTTTEVISTESTGNSEYPSLVVNSAGTIHITWQDATDYAGAGTDEDVFYKYYVGTPAAPELAFIIPNPTEIDTVYLDWNTVPGATIYHVYRSLSYIWSIEDLVPLTSVSSSNYIDSVPSEGFFYYAVVAGNQVGNSSHSNCQYVEVISSVLDAPDLSFILPNPSDSSSVALVWDDIDGATDYYIYRSDIYIWSVEGLTPISMENTNSYVDSLPDEGYYFYVIVATDGLLNSTHSNCEYILYELPSLDEFVIISSLIISTSVVLFVVMRTRKKKH